MLYNLGILFSASLENYNYMLFPFIQSLLIREFSLNYNIGLWVLFLGALFRPLGSLLFGYIGDFYGRKTALFLSIGMMVLSSFLICVLPGCDSIGVYAIVGLVFVRILQVISISGEHAGVSIALIENFEQGAGKRKAGLASGLIYFFSMFGSFLATFVVCQVSQKTWRYAYSLSILLLFFCLILRFLPHDELRRFKSREVDRNLVKSFFACFLFSASMSALYYFNVVFVPQIYFQSYGMNPLIAEKFTMFYLLCYMFSTLFFGWLSDFVYKLFLYIFCSIICLGLVLICTLYWISPYLHLFNIVFLAMYAGPSHAYFFKLFPQHCRYRGIAFAYSLGTSLIGSSSPLIAAFCQYNFIYLIFYLVFLLSLPLIGVFLVRSYLINDER